MKEPTIENIEIGRRIREARQNKKISQEELAYQAKMSAAHISDIELGKKRLLVDSLVRILEVLQVSADSILRPNTPNTNNLYNQELTELLNDCTPSEMEAILKIAREVKTSLHKKIDD